MSSELKSADPDGDDLSREILACENKVYETFLRPQPDVEAFQKLTLPDCDSGELEQLFMRRAL